MVAPTRFCHIVYRSPRFEEMVSWYTRVFEATVCHLAEDIAFLTYDDEHHRFAVLKMAGASEEEIRQHGEPGRVHHVAYAWPNLDQLLHTYKRLKSYGILPFRPTRHGLTLSMYYLDPDSNGLEFQIDLLAGDAASAYMKTEEFANDPGGEIFDPDELVRRYEAGAAVDDLIFRSGQPERLGTRYVRGREPQPLTSWEPKTESSGVESQLTV